MGFDMVVLNFRLSHQVKFGEHVAILGSTKEFGSWKIKQPLNWTENGWVAEFQFEGAESVEYKFVIVKKDGGLVWEGGHNRILKLPKQGKFEIVCHWNKTGEAVDLLPLHSHVLEEEEVGNAHNNGSGQVVEKEVRNIQNNGSAHLEEETSPFVEQWQGKAASFMRSNEHGERERERKWDTSGLEGIVLKLVEGDKNARNWWRKVLLVHIFRLSELL